MKISKLSGNSTLNPTGFSVPGQEFRREHTASHPDLVVEAVVVGLETRVLLGDFLRELEVLLLAARAAVHLALQVAVALLQLVVARHEPRIPLLHPEV